ncbi:MAG: CocE/NonD family hydrolase [Deltaproteobacteria bacterium]|nr:CocE/NonD family hydrolase [Deltaproteobacteria bacterium]
MKDDNRIKDKNGTVHITEKQSVYLGDSIRYNIKDYRPIPVRIPYGAEVEGSLFDGYPQLVKNEGSKPVYNVRIEKDIMVAMRDGVRLATDVYRPDVEGEKFPALLAFGMWGKDAQEAIGWLADKPQKYYHSPFWDGNMEAMNYNFTVPRGYAHIIPDPRGIGNSEGFGSVGMWDIYDMVEWIAVQPWCNGKVGMMGPSSYSVNQIHAGIMKPPHLVALHPDENCAGSGDYFKGIYDLLVYHIFMGRHGNDSAFPAPNYDFTPLPPMFLNHPDIKRRLEDALNHPDIRYNSKWYSYLRYPRKFPLFFDNLLSSFHPKAEFDNFIDADLHPEGINKITLPIYQGAPWITRFYIFATFDVWEKTGTSRKNNKLILYPPNFPDRPYVEYHDELVSWYDYWLKGIDTGIMDEPPIKMFVMGINKWRFENEWPLARTQWTKFYLQPGKGLGIDAPTFAAPDSFTQPAPYLDPTVYCLVYSTGPLGADMEVTGPLALYLEASIDIDDTNWMVDLVDVDPDGKRQLVSAGYLKAAHRALDTTKSLPYQPIHPRQDPVPVPAGEVVEYAIAMMPTSNVFLKGHSIELIIRNQDDLLSRLGTWGVYHLPFMRTVTHHIHFGKSHVLLPVIPLAR